MQDPMARMVHESGEFAEMVELDRRWTLTLGDGRRWDHDIRYGRRTVVAVAVSTARTVIAAVHICSASYAMRAKETSAASIPSSVPIPIPPGIKQ